MSDRKYQRMKSFCINECNKKSGILVTRVAEPILVRKGSKISHERLCF